jgi:hypothetical protein
MNEQRIGALHSYLGYALRRVLRISSRLAVAHPSEIRMPGGGCSTAIEQVIADVHEHLDELLDSVQQLTDALYQAYQHLTRVRPNLRGEPAHVADEFIAAYKASGVEDLRDDFQHHAERISGETSRRGPGAGKSLTDDLVGSDATFRSEQGVLTELGAFGRRFRVRDLLAAAESLSQSLGIRTRKAAK